MTIAKALFGHSPLPPRTAILYGGLMAAALDLSNALTIQALRGLSPVTLLQYVASGLLGRDAFKGGIATAALGGILHVAIMLAMAATYVAVHRRWTLLREQPVFGGIGFGLVTFVIMNYIVVPLSAVAVTSGPAGLMLVNALFCHTILVGLPIALIARRVKAAH